MALNFLDILLNANLGGIYLRKNVQVVDSISSNLPINSNSIIVDGISLSLGNRVLYTNLSDPSKNNRIYEVEDNHNILNLKLTTDGKNSDGSPAQGELVQIDSGLQWEETIWGVNNSKYSRIDFNNLVSSTSSKGFQFLTSESSFTTPIDTVASTLFKFTLVGGGGGGGYSSNGSSSAASGGGGGATVVTYISNLLPNINYTCSIGSAGSGGNAPSTDATDGGDTILTIEDITYTAGGGKGGSHVNNDPGGNGGVALNGVINIDGQVGGVSAASGTNGVAGGGGSSGLGFGLGAAARTVTPNPGRDATGHGGGGGGGLGSFQNGGNGSQGCILVEWS